jgi:hypothetical protein
MVSYTTDIVESEYITSKERNWELTTLEPSLSLFCLELAPLLENNRFEELFPLSSFSVSLSLSRSLSFPFNETCLELLLDIELGGG